MFQGNITPDGGRAAVAELEHVGRRQQKFLQDVGRRPLLPMGNHGHGLAHQQRVVGQSPFDRNADLVKPRFRA